MSAEDWYRNKSWNKDIEEAFFNKLSRSRSQKPQYLKVQASCLVDSHPEVVVKLSKFFRENCPDDFWEQELCLYESKALRNLEENDLAISKAKESLDWREKKPNIQTHIPYWFAELVLKLGASKEYKNSLAALENFHQESPFPLTQFHFFGYSAILLSRLGNTDSAKPLALEALSWAKKDKNMLQNICKQRFGLFKRESAWPLSEIKDIAKR